MSPIGTIKQVEIIKDKIRDFKEYPANTPVVKNLHGPLELSNITIITGDNATGKSTLVRAIADFCGLDSEGGSTNLKLSTKHSPFKLSKYLRIPRVLPLIFEGFYFRADTFYNVVTAIDKAKSTHNYGGRSLHKQSHGQSVKSLFMNHFRGNQLLLLDEPETGLDPDNLQLIKKRIEELADTGSQVIMITHSFALAQIRNAIIYEFGHDYIKRVDYSQSNIYKKNKSALEGST